MQETEEKLSFKFAWVPLATSAFYLLPLLTYPYSTEEKVLLLLGFLVFLYLYFKAYLSTRKKMPYYAVAISLLGFTLIQLNPGSVVWLAFSGFFLGYSLNFLKFLGALLLTLIGVALVGWLAPSSVSYIYFLSIPVLILIGFLGRLEQQKMLLNIANLRSDEEIEALATKLERERIARDLHDLLGHTLTSITLKAELSEKLLKHGHTEEAKEHLKILSEISREVLAQVRHSVAGYQHRGLKQELYKLQGRLEEAGYTFEMEGVLPKLNPSWETELVLILTELTTNVLRHSQGNNCKITWKIENGNQIFIFRDNGREAEITEGRGILGIRERLKYLGGQLHIDLNQQGTVIHIQWPLSGRNYENITR